MPEKTEWKLHGQVLELDIPLTDTIAVIKTKIHELTNMPTGKQKLNWEVSVDFMMKFYLNRPSLDMHNNYQHFFFRAYS